MSHGSPRTPPVSPTAVTRAASTRRPPTSSAPPSSSTPTRPPTRATTSSARRSTSAATAPRCATWTSRARTAPPRTAGAATLKNLDPHYSSGPLEPLVLPGLRGHGARTVNGVAYNSPVLRQCRCRHRRGPRPHIEKVWYRTLSTKLTSRSDYKAARKGAIDLGQGAVSAHGLADLRRGEDRVRRDRRSGGVGHLLITADHPRVTTGAPSALAGRRRLRHHDWLRCRSCAAPRDP